MIAAIACLALAAFLAAGVIHGGLTGKPPIDIALLGGVSVLLFGVSMLFGMLATRK